MSLIFISGIRFFDFQSNHKKKKFNTQLISWIDTGKAQRIDNLGKALKCQASYIITKEIAYDTQSNLLNKASKNVSNAILDAYSKLENFKLRLSQNKPTIIKPIGDVKVEIAKQIM